MMNSKLVFMCMIVAGVLANVSCGTRKPVQSAKASASRAPSLDVQPSAGGTVVQSACKKGLPEECNAIDDNCDGVIDEGCGYKGGDIQITLTWNTGADIDLIVTDPKGETVFYNQQNRNSSSGGHMDHDARGDCRPEQSHSRIENVYWEASRPRGEYKILLNYFSPCGDNAETETTLSIAIGGVVAGTFRHTLEPEERISAATFRIK